MLLNDRFEVSAFQTGLVHIPDLLIADFDFHYFKIISHQFIMLSDQERTILQNEMHDLILTMIQHLFAIVVLSNVLCENIFDKPDHKFRINFRFCQIRVDFTDPQLEVFTFTLNQNEIPDITNQLDPGLLVSSALVIHIL